MAQQSFRSALNGFNREDVVHYIEYLNAQHAAEISRLQSELEFLRSKAPQEAPAASEAADPEIVEQQAARIRELFDQCKAQEATIAELTAQLEKAAQQTGSVSSTDEELEAYRRAERAERVARERAGQIYQQVNGVLADATAKVDEAAALVGSMAGQLSSQLAQFQCAITDSKQALCDAAATMYAIRPEADKQ